MSSVIDKRIVEMQFDNRQFENGVQQSLATLAKLKDSLNLQGAVKGLSELGSAAKNLTFDALGGAVEGVGSKFSAMQEIAIGALRRIGDEIGGLVLKMGDFAKSLSIDQISQGFDKYAQKTSSVQTIMAATADQFSDTGEQMEYVNAQLDKLNWFTDETSYNFLDMVSNIGKFTSNGIKLDDAVTAMQGISNWAAISGQTKNEASRAMYNLSQALAVGGVKLMDWRSIENANMATKEFKEKVLEAAVANGKLKKAADGTFQTISKGTKVSIETFSSTLSEGWFDSKTLMDVLGLYGATTDKLYDLSTATGATATDILTLVEAQQKGKLTTAQLADVLGDAATPKSIANLKSGIEELASSQYEFGIKTFRAAQEAKTFGEAIDSVKDAVSTGWMQSFETIFGDYEKARVLWTDVANNMWEIFNGGAEGRNKLLKDWANSGWEKLKKDVQGAGVDVQQFTSLLKDGLQEFYQSGDLENIIAQYGSLDEAIEQGAFSAEDLSKAIKHSISGVLDLNNAFAGGDLENKLESIKQIANEIWAGEHGNGEERRKAVENLGFDYDTVQKLVNKGKDYVITLEDLSNEELAALGLGEEEIALLKEIMDDEERLLSISGQKGGRELFAEAINQALTDVIQTIQLFKSTWSDVIGDLDAGSLRDWTEQLRDWTQSLALYEENAEGVEVLTERGSQLRAVLEKVLTAGKSTFAVLQNGARILGELAEAFSPVLDALGGFGLTVLDKFAEAMEQIAEIVGNIWTIFKPLASLIANDLANGIKNITSFLSGIDLSGLSNTITPMIQHVSTIAQNFWTILKNIGSTVGTVFKAFAPALQPLIGIFTKLLGFAGQLSGALANLSTIITTALNPVITFLGGAVTKVFETVDKFLGGEKISNIFKPISDALARAGESTGGIGEKLNTFFVSLTEGTKISDTFGSVWDKIAGAFTTAQEALAPLLDSLSQKFEPIKENFSKMWDSILKSFDFSEAKTAGDYIEKTFEGIGSSIFNAFKGLIKGLGQFDLGTVTKGIFAGNVLKKILEVKNQLTEVADGLGEAIGGVIKGGVTALLDSFGDGGGIADMADSILKVAEAIGILTIALTVLSLIPQENLTQGALALASAITTLMVPLSIIYAKVGQVTSWPGFIAMASGMLIASVAALILAGAFAAFSLVVTHTDWENGLIAMGASITIVATALALLANYCKGGALLAAASAILITSVALIALAGAVAAFALVAEHMEGVNQGLQILAMVLGGVVIALAALSSCAVGALAGAAALLVTAVAITALAGAVAVWALVVQNFDMAAALMSMAAAFLVVGAAMAAFGSGALVILAGALSLAAASASILVFSVALGAFLLVLQLAEPALTAVGNGLTNLGNGLMSSLTSLGQGLMALIAGLGAGLGSAIGAILSGIGTGFAAIGTGIGAGATAVGTGFATANELIGQSLESLGTHIGQGFENAGIKIDTGLTAISEGIGKVSTSLSGIGDSIVSIGTALGTFGTNVSGLGIIDLVKIGSGLKSLADGIKQLNKNPLTADASGVNSFVTALQGLTSVSSEVVTATESLKTTMSSLGTEMTQNLANAIQNGSSQVGTAATTIVNNLKVTFDGAVAESTKSGTAIGTNFVRGITSGISGATAAGRQLAQTVVQSLRSAQSQFQQIGYQFSNGLAQGVRSGSGIVSSAVQSVVNQAVSAARRAAQVRSPSRVFAEIGNYMSLGMAKGIDKGSSAVANSTESMVNGAIDGVTNAMNRIVDAINSDVDTDPVITPVLDLSNVQENSKKLDGLLGRNSYAYDTAGGIVTNTAIAQEAANAPVGVMAAIDPASLAALAGNGGTVGTKVDVTFSGSLAQLAAVLQPAITVETNRIGKSLINA